MGMINQPFATCAHQGVEGGILFIKEHLLEFPPGSGYYDQPMRQTVVDRLTGEDIIWQVVDGDIPMPPKTEENSQITLPNPSGGSS